MMKKAIKKLLAALLAVAMVCAMAIPAFAFESWETEEDLNKNHDYIAFQIFKGVISSKDNPTLSDVTWGSHITHPDDFLEKLKDAPIIGAQFHSIDELLSRPAPDYVGVRSGRYCDRPVFDS